MKNDEKKTALVVGASGLIGKQLTQLLIESGYYSEVQVLVRSSLKIVHPRLREIRYDFDKPDASLVKAQDIYCCLGTTMKKAGSKEAFFTVDYEYPLQIARLSLLNGAEKFLIVTAMGANASSTFFYNRVKGEIEEDLRALQFETLHILQPSLLLGDRTERRLGEKIGEVVMKAVGPLMVGPLLKYRAIDSVKVARAMFALAQKPHKGVFFHTSDELQKF
ncbi:NAD-dependent epimerase/dehydratase family protein [Arundinibacter roseus]|uniref:NAD-dependent epimerase/dehydratase family protein n=1 Tax=Arundinibacter roseus TaxID=2070510 RepID=A0A4R4KEH4_9BACT|nr:NAD-dependent epimerase/dehydratase family protein [Arundinibacter roseus]TDB65156.1 NAD-dependent epimerase/dehydratase family protein [Arundinibacter roseus]